MKLIFILFLALILNDAHAVEGDSKLTGSPWFLTCVPIKDSKKSSCFLERTIYLDGKNKVRLLTISIVSLENKQGGILRFLTPLETLLPFGLSLEIPEIKPAFKTTFLYCDLKGCYAQISLKDAQLKSMVLSKEVVISYYYIHNDNKEIKLNIDLGNLKNKFSELEESQ